MKNFDDERAERHEQRAASNPDRGFVIAGKEFTYKPSVRYDAIRARAELSGGTDGATIIATLEDTACLMIEGDPADFLAALHTENGSLPVTFEDLNDVVKWLVEQQVRRPTEALSSSTDGRATTGTDSTETSSSPQEAASTS